MECLNAIGLVRTGTKKPSNVSHVNDVFGLNCIHFVQVSEGDLVSTSSSIFSPKVFSLVDPQSGISCSGKLRTISGFGVLEYQTLLSALVRSSGATLLPSLASFASGGAAVARGGSGGPAASVADFTRLHQVSSMGNVSNVFTLLILSNLPGYILLVRTKSDGCWGLPGGRVDKTEIPWNAAKREFFEETGSRLPHLDGSDFGTISNEPIKFHWKHNSCATGIYCGKTTAKFSDFQRSFKHTKEISEIGVFTPQQILQMALKLDPRNQLRECGRKSTITILSNLGLIV
jgi:8-oxo-dGTP pyrophosphatase MutT (NUDIX family)